MANRIKKLEAAIRDRQRKIAGYRNNLGDVFPPASDQYAARLRDEIDYLEDQRGYWQTVRDRRIADGTASNYSNDTVHPGDYVRISGRWRRVVRANTKTVTVQSDYSWTDRAPWHEVSDHPTAEHGKQHSGQHHR